MLFSFQTRWLSSESTLTPSQKVVDEVIQAFRDDIVPAFKHFTRGWWFSIYNSDASCGDNTTHTCVYCPILLGRYIASGEVYRARNLQV